MRWPDKVTDTVSRCGQGQAAGVQYPAHGRGYGGQALKAKSSRHQVVWVTVLTSGESQDNDHPYWLRIRSIITPGLGVTPVPELRSDNRLQRSDMRPGDGSDDAAAEPHREQAQAPQPSVRPDENGHVTGEPAVVDALALPAELGLRLAAMETTLAELAAQFASDSDRALARERVIDRQHQEIERLKSVERAGQLRPVVTDLCRLRNGLLWQARTIPDEMTGAQVASLLDSFAATAEEALERCGVAVLPREVGAAFAPGRQQVAAVVEIGDPERDGTVAEVLQDGYAEIDSGKVVIPARVRLYRYVTEDKADG